MEIGEEKSVCVCVRKERAEYIEITLNRKYVFNLCKLMLQVQCTHACSSALV